MLRAKVGDSSDSLLVQIKVCGPVSMDIRANPDTQLLW